MDSTLASLGSSVDDRHRDLEALPKSGESVHPDCKQMTCRWAGSAKNVDSAQARFFARAPKRLKPPPLKRRPMSIFHNLQSRRRQARPSPCSTKPKRRRLCNCIENGASYMAGPLNPRQSDRATRASMLRSSRQRGQLCPWLGAFSSLQEGIPLWFCCRPWMMEAIGTSLSEDRA